MRRNEWKWIGGLALSAAMTFALGCPPPATVIYVDDGSTCSTGCGDAANPWPTIAQAFAVAGAGVTVHVNAGVYAESELFVPADGITLEGDGPAATFIDNGGADVTALRVWGRSGVTIRNLAVRNNRQGLNVFWTDPVKTTGLTVTNCAFSNHPWGSIQITQADGVTVSNSTLSGDGGANPFIASIGLGVGATNVTLSGNALSNQLAKGIEVGDGASALVTGNTVDTAGEHCIFVSQGGNGRGTATIQNNSFVRCENGVHSNGGQNVTITANTIASNDAHGILLVDTATATIVNNATIAGNALFGISCEGTPSTNVSCSNNNIQGNGSGAINGCGGACVN